MTSVEALIPASITGMVRYGMVRYGTVWYGTVWYGMANQLINGSGKGIFCKTRLSLSSILQCAGTLNKNSYA